MNREEIYNYIGYMNDKEQGFEITLPETDEKVFEYLDSIKEFIDNITSDTLDEYRKDSVQFFDRSKGYIELEKQFYEKYDANMTFELANKFVKECILFKLSKFKQSDLNECGNIKMLTRKEHTYSIPRIVINSYIREALNQLDNK